MATGFDVETEALRPTEVDGVPGVTLRAHPLEAPSDSEDVSVGYSVFLRGRDLYAIRCESTSSREEELDEACEELLASLRLRPYRPPASEGSPGTSNEDSIPLAEFIQRADSACRKATGEGFAGLTPPAYDREQASAAEMRRLAPFLEDFLAATLDLESDLAALPKPEGREEEWRRALRLEAGVLVPTVRSALRAARRREGREVSSKLNGLGVAVGDLKEAFAAVGLKICSA